MQTTWKQREAYQFTRLEDVDTIIAQVEIAGPVYAAGAIPVWTSYSTWIVKIVDDDLSCLGYVKSLY